MKLNFLNRKKEIIKINRILSEKGKFVVIYGRRRCGKSRLIKSVKSDNDIYYQAIQADPVLQIESFTREVGRIYKGFDAVKYPNWESVFINIEKYAVEKINIFIDEFTYLAESNPSFPSVLQKYLDNRENSNINLIVSGSSQRMMHNTVLNSNSPLYGRADARLKIKPLNPGYLLEALNLDPITAVEYYSVFDGIPRYWELAGDYNNLKDAAKELLLDPDGILHDEVKKLLLDELRTAEQPLSILNVIGQKNHTLSSIAKRLQKKETSLSRPLAILIDLGYINREIKFLSNLKKRTGNLYKFNDLLFKFYFRFVQPNISLLEQDMLEETWNFIQPEFNLHISETWEELARKSVSSLHLYDIEWRPAYRWWDKNTEIDVLSLSLDKKYLLAGEVKWTDNLNISKTLYKLKESIKNIPDIPNVEKIYYAIWTKNKSYNNKENIIIISPEDVFTFSSS